jgi:hypothetical protein
MITIIKKPKYSVICQCRETLAFDAEDVKHKADRVYGDVPASEGGEKASYIVDRYFIICRKCGNHPNVARIASAKMKKEAKQREV